MAIDTTTPEGKEKEKRIASLHILKRKVREAAAELDWLILATPTGDRRACLTEANIHLLGAAAKLSQLKSED